MYVMSNDVSKYCVTLRRTVFHAPLTFTLRINMATTRTDASDLMNAFSRVESWQMNSVDEKNRKRRLSKYAEI